MTLHNHIRLFRDSLLKRYSQVDISYQIDRRYDTSVLLRINSSEIKEVDIIDELLELFEGLGEEGFSLVLLDDETLLTFDPQLSIVGMSFADSRFQNNRNIVIPKQVDIASSCTCFNYACSLAA